MGGIEDIFEDLLEGIGRRRRSHGGYGGPRDDRREPERDSGQRYCSQCGAAAAPAALFCAECGTRLASARSVPACPSCGRELEAGARFCPACGSPVR